MNATPPQIQDWTDRIRDVRGLLSTLPAELQKSAGLIPLGTTDENNPRERRKRSIRLSDSARMETRRQAQKVRQIYSPISSQRNCGLHPIPDPEGASPPLLVVKSKGAHFSGLATCGNQFCPDCMGAARGARAARIQGGIQGARAAGMEPYFVTFTSARSRSASSQIESHSAAWRAFTKAVHYELKKSGSKMHYVRSHDVTFRPHSRDVFHNHFHSVIVLDGRYPDFSGLLARSWAKAAKRQNLRVSLEAQDIQAVTEMTEEAVAAYGAKWWGIDKELSAFAQKEGRKSSATGEMSYGWMELMGLCHDGAEQAIRAYRAHLTATASKKTMVFSKDWKELEEMAPPAEEEELEEEEENKELWSIHVPLAWWPKVRELKGDLLVTAHWLALTKPRHLVFLENLWKSDYEYEEEEGESLGLEALYIQADAGPTPERVNSLHSWISRHYPKHLWTTRFPHGHG